MCKRFGHARGLYALGCDEEACLHYGLKTDGLAMYWWRLRCYALGFIGSDHLTPSTAARCAAPCPSGAGADLAPAGP